MKNLTNNYFQGTIKNLKIVNYEYLYLQIDIVNAPENRLFYLLNSSVLIHLPFFLLPSLVINYSFNQKNNLLTAFFRIKGGEVPSFQILGQFLGIKIKIIFHFFLFNFEKFINKKMIIFTDHSTVLWLDRALTTNNILKIIFVHKGSNNRLINHFFNQYFQVQNKNIIYVNTLQEFFKFKNNQNDFIYFDCLEHNHFINSEFNKNSDNYFFKYPAFICKNRGCGGCGLICDQIYYQTCLNPVIKKKKF